MAAVISLILVLVLSLIVVRVATVALMLTGLSRDLARFQARSAFTGAGFTTSESENVVRHPVRRRIVMILMLLGNAGIATVIASMILSFVTVSAGDVWWNAWWFRLLVLLVSVSALLVVAYSKWIDHRMSRVIAWALKRFTSIDARDYAGLLHLTGEFAVSELQVRHGDWLAEQTLTKLHLNAEGVLVLGIERVDGRYVGAPRGETVLHVGDVLILYGRQSTLTDLDRRQAGPHGNRRHIEAVSRQADLERREREEDEQFGETDRDAERAKTRADSHAG